MLGGSQGRDVETSISYIQSTKFSKLSILVTFCFCHWQIDRLKMEGTVQLVFLVQIFCKYYTLTRSMVQSIKTHNYRFVNFTPWELATNYISGHVLVDRRWATRPRAFPFNFSMPLAKRVPPVSLYQNIDPTKCLRNQLEMVRSVTFGGCHW